MSGLSPSFLGALERGETDIALERLAALAAVFDHDVGSFLGFAVRGAQPRFLGEDQRLRVERGERVDYEVIRLPGLGLELVRVSLAPHTRFASALTHEGVDVTLVVEGTLVATYAGVDYEMTNGACAIWSGGYPHTFRNDTRKVATYVGLVTATPF